MHIIFERRREGPALDQAVVRETAISFPLASQDLAGLEVDEVHSCAGQASYRFIIVIVVRCDLDAVLHALVGYRAGKEYVFHSVLAMRPCGPARLTETLMVQRKTKPPMVWRWYSGFLLRCSLTSRPPRSRRQFGWNSPGQSPPVFHGRGMALC